MGNSENCYCSYNKCRNRCQGEDYNINLTKLSFLKEPSNQIYEMTAEKFIESRLLYHSNLKNNNNNNNPIININSDADYISQKDEEILSPSALIRLKSYSVLNNLNNNMNDNSEIYLRRNIDNTNKASCVGKGMRLDSPFKGEVTEFNHTNILQKDKDKNIDNFASRPTQSQSNYVEGLIVSDEATKLKIRELLDEQVFFNRLTDEKHKEEILNNFYEYSFPEGTIIYQEGAFGNLLFILKNGLLQSSAKIINNINKNSSKSVIPKNNTSTNITKFKLEEKMKDVKVRQINQWEIFGESSLIQNSKRNETVMCIVKCNILAFDTSIYKKIIKTLADEDKREKFEFLNKTPLINALDNVSLNYLCEKMELTKFSPKQKIIGINEIGDCLYIIKSGQVSCELDNKEIRKLTSGEIFGQNSILFNNHKRTMDVFSINETECYKICLNDLIEIYGKNEYKKKILFSIFKSIISKNEILKNVFLESFINKIFNAFTIQFYGNNEKIVNNSNINNKSNDNDMKSSNQRIIIIIEGGIFESSLSNQIGTRETIVGYDLIYDKNYTLSKDYFAYPDCTSFECKIEDLDNIIGVEFSKVKVSNNNSLDDSVKTPAKFYRLNTENNNNNNYNIVKNINPNKLLSRISKLQKIFLFQYLKKETLEKLALKLKKRNYFEGEVIISENSIGNTFYLIIKGRVRVSKKGKILRDLESGNFFGEIALFDEKNTKRTATVTAIDVKVVCYELTKSDFDFIITNTQTKEYLLQKISLRNEFITLDDLYHIKFLGKGKFGNVNLVHDKKNIYAIKSFSRSQVNNQKLLAQYFVNERRVMLILDHPFIVKMVKTLKNDLFCFYLLEYINGISLEEHIMDNIKKKKLFNFSEVQFYSAIILNMIDYLHQKYIAHRDIKPSNIMIDYNGYLKLIDFGTSKIIKDYTCTIIGTPHYMAPEILKGKGYSLSCDYWSVGICIYEMFYCSYPFGNKAKETNDIYNEILNKKLTFPNVAFTHNAKLGSNINSNNNNNNLDNFNGHYNTSYTDIKKIDYLVVNKIITCLLMKNYSKRLCNYEALKKQDIFKTLNWEELIELKIDAPFIPNIHNIKHLDQYTEKFEDFIKNELAHNNQKLTENTKKNTCKNFDATWANEF